MLMISDGINVNYVDAQKANLATPYGQQIIMETTEAVIFDKCRDFCDFCQMP